MKTGVVGFRKFTIRNSCPGSAITNGFGRNLVNVVCVLTLVIAQANAAPVQLLSARSSAVSLPTGGNANSAAPVLSPDGRFVVFSSAANDLVPGGNNYYSVNVFLRDRASNTTVLVSGNLSGTGGGNGHSMLGEASTNGQLVVFQSAASDLVPNDTNGCTDIFVRNLAAGTTALASVATNGGPANGASTDPVITPDGHYVAFISRASNLVPNDTNGIPDIFVRDLIAGTNCLVSVNAVSVNALRVGGSSTPVMATPVITPDGRYVAFFSTATNLVSAVPGTSTGEVYLRDRLTGTTIWASTNAAAIVSATLGLSGVPAFNPKLSDDGRYVVFKAGPVTNGAAVILEYDSTTATTAVVSTNAVAGWSVDANDNNGPEMTPNGSFITFVQNGGALSPGYSSVHVWDSRGAVDTLVSGVSTNTQTPLISPDGRLVAFLSNAAHLTGNAVSNGFHIYLCDLQAGTTQLVDADTNGVGSTDETTATLGLSADGRFVAFSSPDGSLVGGDHNRAEDVFVRDMAGGTTELVSARDATVISQAADGFNLLSQWSVSADGRWAAFASMADDLVRNDTNGGLDVFVRDLVNGTNLLVSVGFDGSSALGGSSGNAVISTNGRYVVFTSSATNLVAGVANTNNNVFRRDLQTGTTVVVSVGTNGVSPGNDASSDLMISPDGRYVVFLSLATNLAPGITSGMNTYWRDVDGGRTVGLKANNAYPFAPSLSSNGRYVAYAYGISGSSARLQIRDTQLGTDIYTNAGNVTSAAIDPTGTNILYEIVNTSAGTTTLYADNIATGLNLFSTNTTASIQNAACWSDDGRWLTFVSSGSVYLRDFQTGTLSVIGRAGPSTGYVNSSDGPVLSGNGRFVAYRSIVTNTVIGDKTAPPNVFLLDRLTGSNMVLTARQPIPGPLSWVSKPVISDSGATVIFLNAGSGLAPGDLNRVPDVYGWVDTDADGIPNWWMTEYFGHPTGLASDHTLAQDSYSGDEISNLQKYLTGMNPLIWDNLHFVAAQALPDTAFKLTIFGQVGRNYSLLASSDLKTWTPILNFACTNATMDALDCDAKHFGARFYRLVTPPWAPVMTLGAGAGQPLGTNGLNLSLTGTAGVQYRVDASSDLINWTAVTNFVSTNTTVYFTDQSATNYSKRFYRAVAP